MCFSQELMSRTSLETQKLDLMDEVSFLKLKLVGIEETHTNTQQPDPSDTEQNKAEVCVCLCVSVRTCMFQLAISAQLVKKLQSSCGSISSLNAACI